ncbi:MAG: hypothetical protein LBV51_02835, partial [Acholeplasmatales bacterium]|nr:hypothetical protein [Acholeplasmatales bacterium]
MIKKTTEQFIEEAIKIHGSTYDYSKVNYTGTFEKVIIGCKEHGYFEQIAHKHLMGHGCRRCAQLIRNNSSRVYFNTEDWVNASKKVHGEIYDYSKSIFTSFTNKLIITCKNHGDFEQSANKHLRGHGCPNCKNSLGELKIRKFLLDHNIKFEQQKKFDGCKDVKSLFFDFYINNKNIVIEFQGEQHFRGDTWFDSHTTKRDTFEKRQKRDQIKKDFCKLHNIELLEILYNRSE